ncbi:hypothetical protein LS70_006610 [Helicobacter sp. MIT 11-5569]|uniref:glycosyltransferase family 9 protein n=1 Tax=Helicobacter sp. MIT 11-5569 TaxID=1548151 RepID=UPI00051FA8D4|nr:hypothetical protein [Helicobacter sp. MIT 11-5569]TLD82643.1 hypothetical protein LS70_006610 [Helicobacter sp. MIT 11-5569]
MHVDTTDKTTREKNFADCLKAHPVDILLLLHRTSWKIKVANNSATKRVVTELHMHTLLNFKFKSPLMMISYFVHGTEKILRLVRQINPKYYDNNISKIDFAQVRFQIPQENQDKIHTFLEQCKNDKPYEAIVGINPFGSSALFNFDTQDWINLAQLLASQFPNILFIMLTYKENPCKLEPFKEQNISIFENDNQLINLIALTKHFNVLLSLNTGNIHIADILRIPTLIINKTKERYNCIGGSYGGEFDAVYLPKNWAQNYKHYYATYTKKCLDRIQKLKKQQK